MLLSPPKYQQYFRDGEVLPEFAPEFLSLWQSWLGPERLHELDAVTESEWAKFNVLLSLVTERYQTYLVDISAALVTPVGPHSELFRSYADYMNSESSQFRRLIIPDIECVLEEHWDFTWILWHKQSAAINALHPLIEEAGLFHFADHGHNHGHPSEVAT